jgi:chromosome segregation ATPase
MEKIEEWFTTLSQKIDKVSSDVMAVRGELSDIRDFIEQHQTDIRLCKLAIERVDDKIEHIKKNPH